MSIRASSICNYASCMETCENGVVITLRVPDVYDTTKAQFCCAAHAAASLRRLSKDRKEPSVELPRLWKHV